MLALILVTASHASAIEPMALPEFTVQGMDGAPVESAQISQEPRWILLYISRDCRTCDEILQTLEAFKDAPLSNRVVILSGGGVPSDLDEIKSQREKTASFGWYADPEWSAYPLLRISGAPVIFGIRSGIIEWSLAGSPWDAKNMQTVLRDWINY